MRKNKYSNHGENMKTNTNKQLGTKETPRWVNNAVTMKLLSFRCHWQTNTADKNLA